MGTGESKGHTDPVPWGKVGDRGVELTEIRFPGAMLGTGESDGDDARPPQAIHTAHGNVPFHIRLPETSVLQILLRSALMMLSKHRADSSCPAITSTRRALRTIHTAGCTRADASSSIEHCRLHRDHGVRVVSSGELLVTYSIS